MKPMMANPIAVAIAIFWNSEIKVEIIGNLPVMKKSAVFTFLVGLGAPLDQPDGILGELLHRFDGLNDLIHGLFLELCEDEGRMTTAWKSLLLLNRNAYTPRHFDSLHIRQII